jgi:alpha-beta hydrolase superfamily lysophospholipase
MLFISLPAVPSPRVTHVRMQAMKRLLKNAASRDVTLYEVPGGYHELFMGPERDDITDRIVGWILDQAQLKADTS